MEMSWVFLMVVVGSDLTLTQARSCQLFLCFLASISISLIRFLQPLVVPHVLADGDDLVVADGGGRLRPETTPD
jgi:hypothetical protein